MAGESTDALRVVRGDMCRRIDAIETLIARRGPIGARPLADDLAAVAAEYGLVPARRLAEGLAVALGEGGRGAAVAPWIERLREVLACPQAGTGESDAWLASVMVRFAG